jgi:hypothetical protein
MEFISGQYLLALVALAGFFLVSLVTTKLKANREGKAEIEWREVLAQSLEYFTEWGHAETLGGVLRNLSQGNKPGAISELRNTISQLQQPERALPLQDKNFVKQLTERLKDPKQLVEIEEQTALAKQKLTNAAAKLVDAGGSDK